MDIWGDKLDHSSGTWVLLHQAPPNPPAPGTEVAHGTYGYSGDGSSIIATIPAATFQGAPGPHFKIEVDNDNSKSKTFWVTCAAVQPSIATMQLPSSAKVGDVLKDKATLGNTNEATGTITFRLFDPNGHEAYHESVTVSKYHTAYTTPNGFMAYGPGTWHWAAEYSGDANNPAVHSQMADEPVTVSQATPTLTTAQNPKSGLVGATLQDSATLTGYHPTGSITFFLNNPSGQNVYHETINVTSGNGTYSTVQGFAATSAGTWQWWAEYNGDVNNSKVHTTVGDEPVTIATGGVEAATATPTGAVLAATGASTPDQSFGLFLAALGLLAMVGGAFAWRRREA